MWRTIGKAALAASFIVLTPAASMLSGGQAQAHSDVYVSGSVSVGFPSLVVGFSYGDPFLVGHVHYSPVPCAAGPLYYYPAYDVYAHYYPRYVYSYYPHPYGYQDVHVYHHSHGGYYRGGHGHYGYHGNDGYRGYSPKYRGHSAYVRSNGQWHGDHKGNGYKNGNGNGHGDSGHKGKGRNDNGRHGGGRGNGHRGH